jgi:isochorismate synthase
MIAWDRLGRRLALLARRSPADAVLSVGVELPTAPAAIVPSGASWFHWQRPDVGLRLTGVGETLAIESGGTGRFAALGAAWNGLAAVWRRDEDGDGGPPPLAFAGFAFAPDGGAPLPNASLTVPALLLRADGGRHWAQFSCTAATAADAVAHWRALWQGLSARAAGGVPPRLAPRAAPLEEQAFLARGHAALAAIGRGEVDKLVLTRSVRFETDAPLAVWPVLEALAAANPGCAVWAVGRHEQTFLGASPELLLELRDGGVAVDALAGTVWSGGGETCPPLEGDKNRREHELVTAAVAEALAPLCEDLAVPPAPEIMSVQDIRHLRRRIRGRRRDGAGAFDFLARVHPTPAVGGTPTAAAVDWLAAHGDRRGAWYTGGIGWLGADGTADFAVALRCGLVDGREVALYAGAGFVRGSAPQQEFAETEAKLAPMLAALRAAGTREAACMTGT